jgi:hypothetical protein
MLALSTGRDDNGNSVSWTLLPLRPDSISRLLATEGPNQLERNSNETELSLGIWDSLVTLQNTVKNERAMRKKDVSSNIEDQGEAIKKVNATRRAVGRR